MGKFRSALREGKKVLTNDGYSVDIISYEFWIKGISLMCLAIKDASGNYMRVGFFGNDTGCEYTLDGEITEIYDSHLMIEKIEQIGWFIIEDQGFGLPKLSGLFSTKAEAQTHLGNSVGTIEKMIVGAE